MGKKIAFDLDGVFTELPKYLEKYGKKYLDKPVIDRYENSLIKMFGCTKKEELNFWRKFLFHYSKNVHIKAGIKTLINSLEMNGDTIYLISARIKAHEDNILGKCIRKLVYDWLEENNINLNKENIIFVDYKDAPKQKSKICSKLNIDYMIDDTIEVLECIKENTKTIPITFVEELHKNIDNDMIKVNYFNQVSRYIDDNIIYYYSYEKIKGMDDEEVKKYEQDYISLSDKIFNDAMMNERINKNLRRLTPILTKPIQLSTPYKVIGEENIANVENAIYACNHQRTSDTWMMFSILTNLNKNVRALFKAELKKSPLRFLYNKIGTIYVQRDNKDSRIDSFCQMINELQLGNNIIIFPEGTRNNQLGDFSIGAVKMAKMTKKPVIPTSIIYNGNLATIVFEKPIYIKTNQDCIVETSKLKEKISENINTYVEEEKDIIKVNKK